ncbi:MAG: DUF4166 domain-containing protein [Pseudomonadota bacterium]
MLGAEGWGLLPAAIRQRFSNRLADRATAIYRGHLTAVRISPLGHLLANILRLFGAPLPLSTDRDVPSVVTVTEDVRHGGQVWTRLYANRQGFPQVIHSAKRFAGPTGLEEYLGFGLSMALALEPRPDALLFHSAGYVWRLGRFDLRLPRWLEPGQLLVEHRDCTDQHGPGAFIFALTLHHPWFGELVHQAGIYREAA